MVRQRRAGAAATVTGGEAEAEADPVMERDEMATRICCALIAIADPDHVDPEWLAACAVATADALLVKLGSK